MPHINSRSGGGDDLASTDEVKVYNDEGAEEIEQRSSEKFLSEDKLGLVKETEQEKSTISGGRGFPVAAKSAGGSEDKSIGPPPANDHHIGGFFYRPLANGATSLAASGKVPPVGFQPHPGLMTYGDIMAQPPPAHSGIQVVPAMHIGYKAGLPRSSIFPIPASSQYSMYPDFVPGWPGAAGYAMPPMGGFHAAPYMHYMAAVAGGLLPPHPALSPHSPVGLSQSALIGQGLKQDSPLQHHVYDAAAVAAAAATRFSNSSVGSGSSGGAASSNGEQAGHGSSSRHHSDGSSAAQIGEGGSSSLGTPGQSPAAEKKMRVHIKKPLNAFMLFMKEMRAAVVSECTLKESAAINQILGRKWHELDRAQQAKYYDMAKKEREQHMKLYPGWSARDNYAMHSKKKKKQQHLKETGRVVGGSSTATASSSSSSLSACCSASPATAAGLDGGEAGKECMHPKKCRARFGLDKQSQWCKPCRRSAAVAAYGGCQQQPSSATPVPAAAAAAAVSPGFCRRKKKCVIQHLSDAQVQSVSGSGGGSFDNSLSPSDDNDCDISTDAAENYYSQASANDLDDSNGGDLVMDQDDDNVHDVGDSFENQGDADARLATHMHQLSTQRGHMLAPAAAGSAAAVSSTVSVTNTSERTHRGTSVGAVKQEPVQEL